MPYVIGENCLGERYAICASVCPIDCIYPGDYDSQVFMVIDPVICIDCGLCLPECPVGAIVANAEEDPKWAAINKELAPKFQPNQRAQARPRDDPPRMPGHTIVNPLH